MTLSAPPRSFSDPPGFSRRLISVCFSSPSTAAGGGDNAAAAACFLFNDEGSFDFGGRILMVGSKVPMDHHGGL